MVWAFAVNHAQKLKTESATSPVWKECTKNTQRDEKMITITAVIKCAPIFTEKNFKPPSPCPPQQMKRDRNYSRVRQSSSAPTLTLLDVKNIRILG